MLPTMDFGRTGHKSSRTLFGAAALGNREQAESDRTVEYLLEAGVNHIDTAAGYGLAEERLGPSMVKYRDRFFLATKTGDRTYAKAKESIARSLERMKTDHVDLLQLHFLVDETDWQTTFGNDGALRAVVEAKEQGLARFLGVTGHGLSAPAMHMRSLDQYPFDSVLLPWNYLLGQNHEYRAGFEKLCARCVDGGIAIQTIKSIARGPWGEKERSRTTWYEPLEDQDAIDDAVFWVLSDERVFLNTVGDIDVLPRVIDAASRFDGARPPDDRMDARVEKSGVEPLFLD